MLKYVAALLVAMFASCSAASAEIRVIADVNLKTQQLTAFADGKFVGEWKISSGKPGYRTPTGTYTPTWLSPNHWSKKYDAPMPFAVFFTGGYAIHATNAIAKLGQPASHGCVRLAKDNAAQLFDLVETYGKEATRVIVHGGEAKSTTLPLSVPLVASPQKRKVLIAHSLY